MTSCYLNYELPYGTLVECDDCGMVTTSAMLGGIRDLELRVYPGGIVPAGECECGALAYVVEPLKRRDQGHGIEKLNPPRIYQGTSEHSICNACNHEGDGFRRFAEPLSVDDAPACEWLACPRCNHGSLGT